MAAAADPSHLSSLQLQKSLHLARCQHINLPPYAAAIAATYGRYSAVAPPAQPPALLALHRDPRLPIPPPPAAAPVPLHQEENRVSKVGHNLDVSKYSFFKDCHGVLTDGDKTDRILPVRHQGKTNSCYAFTAVNAIAGAAAEGGLQGCHGSEQELLDRLPHFPEPSGVRPHVPDEGLPNNFDNTFTYVIKKGLSFVTQYKWVGKYQSNPPTPLTFDQNSFGPEWGHQGYFKVRRHAVSSICYPVKVYTARKNCTENDGADVAEHEDSDDMDID